MLSEDRILATVEGELGESFTLAHLEEIRDEVRKAISIVAVLGKDYYQDWYLLFSNVFQTGEQIVRNRHSDWFARWFMAKEVRRRIAVFNNDLKIQHAVFKAIEIELPD